MILEVAAGSRSRLRYPARASRRAIGFDATLHSYGARPLRHADVVASKRFALDDRATGARRYQATRCDLVFGSNSQLRAVAEVYAENAGQARFVRDFVKVWDKVMMLDRYDVRA